MFGIIVKDFSSPESKVPGELIGWPAPSSVVVHTFELEYLCSLQADLNQILSVASDRSNRLTMEKSLRTA